MVAMVWLARARVVGERKRGLHSLEWMRGGEWKEVQKVLRGEKRGERGGEGRRLRGVVRVKWKRVTRV